jgi:hypothetical protein
MNCWGRGTCPIRIRWCEWLLDVGGDSTKAMQEREWGPSKQVVSVVACHELIGIMCYDTVPFGFVLGLEWDQGSPIRTSWVSTHMSIVSLHSFSNTCSSKSSAGNYQEMKLSQQRVSRFGVESQHFNILNPPFRCLLTHHSP